MKICRILQGITQICPNVSHGSSSDRQQRVYDVCLVLPPQKPGLADVEGHSSELIHWPLFEYLLMVPANRLGYADGLVASSSR